MKALKLTVFIIVVIIILFLAVPIFFANEVSVSKQQCMKALPEQPFRQVNKLKNWEHWSPFNDDTTMRITYGEQVSGEGASYSWTGERAGKGSLTIIESKPYSLIRTRVDFGPEGKVTGTWNFKTKGDSTCVHWTLKISGLKYPFGRWLGFMMKSGLKPVMQQGLEKMKKIVESEKSPAVIKEVTLDTRPAIVIIDSTTLDGLENLLQKNFDKLMKFASKKHVNSTGAPFAVYFNWNPDGIIKIGAGIPVNKKVATSGNIKYFELPAGKTLLAKHFGSHDTGATHEQMEDYMNEHHLEIRGFIWESYITDPASQKDKNQYETDIYYPVQAKK